MSRRLLGKRFTVHNMHIKAQWPPAPGDLLTSLAGPLALISEALAHGADEGVKYHEALRRPTIDPWLYSHIARNEARYYLISGGIEEFGFDVADLAMSGIHLRRDDVHLRVLKMGHTLNSSGQSEHAVPGPGHSHSRREYFHQPALMRDDESLSLDIARPLKLVVLWEQDPLHQLGSLELACPRRWSASRNCVETYWLVPVNETAAGLGVDGTYGHESFMLDDFELNESAYEEQAASDG